MTLVFFFISDIPLCNLLGLNIRIPDKTLRGRILTENAGLIYRKLEETLLEVYKTDAATPSNIYKCTYKYMLTDDREHVIKLPLKVQVFVWKENELQCIDPREPHHI